MKISSVRRHFYRQCSRFALGVTCSFNIAERAELRQPVCHRWHRSRSNSLNSRRFSAEYGKKEIDKQGMDDCAHILHFLPLSRCQMDSKKVKYAHLYASRDWHLLIYLFFLRAG